MNSLLTRQAFRTTRTQLARCLRTVSAVADSSRIWSDTLCFASPESDFVSAPETALGVVNAASFFKAPVASQEWSESLSFASPEADFSANPSAADVEWSGSLSFASPESDFVAVPEAALGVAYVKDSAEAPAAQQKWSNTLSFAAPESEFAAPETALGVVHMRSFLEKPAEEPELSNDHLKLLMKSPIMDIMMPQPETPTGFVHAHSFLDSRQLVKLHQQHLSDMETALPKTLQEALGVENDPRAIVVTEAMSPFRIVDVNESWVGLCGFSKDEARHKSLGIIQGPGTNSLALDALMDELLHGNEATALLTNYTKDGRKFFNFLRVGPIVDAANNITHFVGVLQEVTEEPDYYHMAA